MDLPVQKRIRDAIRSGDDATAQTLIASDPAQVLASTPFGTWLHVASCFGRLAIVRFLVGVGADVNTRGGTFGGTPLNEAAGRGHLAVVEYLLSVGGQMETRKPEANPLFSAIYGGHSDVVRLLLARGIDPSVRYTGQRMRDMDAEAFARERGQVEIAQLLWDQRHAEPGAAGDGAAK